MQSSGTRFRLGLLIALFTVPIVALGLFIGSITIFAAPGTPLGAGAFYINPSSTASQAVKAAELPTSSTDAATTGLLSSIAAQPTAIWLLPEKYPLESVALSVSEILADAESKEQLPVFVIYGVPNRDCGNHSGGGLTAAEYPLWVGEIADALATSDAVVILEPDSLALATECHMQDERVAQISDAVTILAATRATVYLDGGHSNWLPASTMADLLLRAGIERVRGFATNVSNYNSSATEHVYAEEISALTHDSRYVVDTSRNGLGSSGEWCNPAGRALGAPPAVVNDGGQDANLWIKQPGESDGLCNGGPVAGHWWNERAIELARNAGW